MRPRQLPIAAAAIAAGSFAVWLWWPWDGAALLDLRWQEWPQGAVLFSLGLLWGEGGWRGRMPVAWSRRCRQVAAAGLAAVGLLAAGTNMAHGGLDRLFGGWHRQSLAFVVLQGVVAVTFSLWVVAWFGRRWSRQGMGGHSVAAHRPLPVRTHRGGFAGPAYGIEFTTRRRLPARCPGLVLEQAVASALIRGEEPPQVFRV